jgi:hypothetical protein
LLVVVQVEISRFVLQEPASEEWQENTEAYHSKRSLQIGTLALLFKFVDCKLLVLVKSGCVFTELDGCFLGVNAVA